MADQVLTPTRAALGGRAVRLDDDQPEREDSLGIVAALLIALPIALALWALIAWLIYRAIT